MRFTIKRALVNSQFNMIGKFLGRLGEVQEQPVGVFALIVVELYHCPGVQELVEEPTTILP